MKKLNIGLFIDTWFPMIDGVINVVDNYATRLSKYANVTVFACGTGKKDNRVYPYKVVRGGHLSIPFFDYELPLATKKLKKEIKNANLDIIHVHSPFSICKAGLEYGKKHNIPVVATLHSQYYRDFCRYAKSKTIAKILLKSVRNFYNSCDKVFTTNDKMVEVAEEYGITPSPSIQNNGTSLEFIENTTSAFEFFEKKYNIKKDEVVLLFVGRINKIKNLEFLIDALAKLKNLGQSFKMLFVGSGADTDSLKSKVKKLNLDNEVIFTGRVSDEELLYSYIRTKLFLFPSFYDSDGLVRIEAASQKKPTVLISGSVASATVTENVNGFLSENNVDKYAQKLYDILHDDELYNKVSQKAFEDLYITWDKTVENMFQKYLTIMEDYKKEHKQ